MSQKAKGGTVVGLLKKFKIKRKGVHAKTKESSNKASKNYKKQYRGQGK
jgi:hypothetical protein